MKAGELYLNVFLPEANGMGLGTESVDAVSSPRSAGAGERGEDTASTMGLDQGSEWDALREMRDLLKLRHYSPRTL